MPATVTDEDESAPDCSDLVNDTRFVPSLIWVLALTEAKFIGTRQVPLDLINLQSSVSPQTWHCCISAYQLFYEIFDRDCFEELFHKFIIACDYSAKNDFAAAHAAMFELYRLAISCKRPDGLSYEKLLHLMVTFRDILDDFEQKYDLPQKDDHEVRTWLARSFTSDHLRILRHFHETSVQYAINWIKQNRVRATPSLIPPAPEPSDDQFWIIVELSDDYFAPLKAPVLSSSE
jgi:hypothetical protein